MREIDRKGYVMRLFINRKKRKFGCKKCVHVKDRNLQFGHLGFPALRGAELMTGHRYERSRVAGDLDLAQTLFPALRLASAETDLALQLKAFQLPKILFLKRACSRVYLKKNDRNTSGTTTRHTSRAQERALQQYNTRSKTGLQGSQL